MKEDEHPINLKGWMDAYPTISERQEFPLAEMTVEELAIEMDDTTNNPGKDYVVVDVRRADCMSMIPGAINLPAQSFCVSLPALVQILAPIPLVIFHCSRSNGRGPRAAGWYADALQKHLNLSDQLVSQRVRVLKGGIVAWEARFGEGSMGQRGVQSDKQSVQL